MCRSIARQVPAEAPSRAAVAAIGLILAHRPLSEAG
jgi:hypothetical protein